jgi:hypothetical protein
MQRHDIEHLWTNRNCETDSESGLRFSTRGTRQFRFAASPQAGRVLLVSHEVVFAALVL